MKKKRILVVEDSPDLCAVYVSVLSKHYEVTVSIDPIEISCLIPQSEFVLSDYHGVPFNVVRDECERQHVPLLLVTGELERYYTYQVSKPISVDHLLAEIEARIE